MENFRSMMLIAAWLLIGCVSIASSSKEECDIVGDKQSPIDIDIANVIPTTAPSLTWSSAYQDLPDDNYLVNDGHSLKLYSNSSEPLTLTGGELSAKYEFEQLHFHWADSDNKGSEHTIMSHSYPLEMHVVHSQFKNNNTNQYAVVAYFFRLSRRENPGLKNILEIAISAAQRQQERVAVKPFPLNKLVQTSTFSYYTYQGSLTTPPYTESVYWIIVATALPISPRQLQTFREAALLDKGLLNNYRATQDLNGRTVRFLIPSSTNGLHCKFCNK